MTTATSLGSTPSTATAATTEVVKIKGVALKGTAEFIRSKLGDEGVAKALALLPDEARATLSRSILATELYPMPWLVALIDAAARVVGGDRRETIRQTGRFSCEMAMTSVYRIFLKVGSPEFIFGKATQMFSNYFKGLSGDNIRILDRRKGFGRVEIDKFNGGHADFCRRLDGYFERLLELTGEKKVVVTHTKCCYREKDKTTICEWNASWGE